MYFKKILSLRSEQTSIQAISTFKFNISDLDSDLIALVQNPFISEGASGIFLSLNSVVSSDKS